MVGDAAYRDGEVDGDALPRLTRDLDETPLCLHAWKIRFAHPASGEPMAFTAPPPDGAWAQWPIFVQANKIDAAQLKEWLSEARERFVEINGKIYSLAKA